MENENNLAEESNKKTLVETVSPLKKAYKIASTGIIVIVVAFAILLAGVRFIGFKPYAVLSGSMTPKYKVGSLVYIKATDASNINKGDVITFVSGTDRLVVTHRVTRINEDNTYFFTKGDANENEDASPVYYENVLGRVSFSIPLLGYVSMYLATTSGRFAILAFVFLLVATLLIPEVIKQLKIQK